MANWNDFTAISETSSESTAESTRPNGINFSPLSLEPSTKLHDRISARHLSNSSQDIDRGRSEINNRTEAKSHTQTTSFATKSSTTRKLTMQLSWHGTDRHFDLVTDEIQKSASVKAIESY